jgi:FkbM family methyltransferase
MTLSPFLRSWLLAVNVVDRLPGLRQLHWRPPLRRWYLPLRAAALLGPSLRFLLFELSRRRAVRPYTLRESGLTVHVRHPLNDMWIVDEIFVQRVYEPPPEVLQRIGRLGRAPRFLDLGGHAGLFALFALGRFPGSQVTSLEPNGENAAVLDASRRAGDLADRWTLVRAAAGPREGTVRIGGPSFLSHVSADAEGGVCVPMHDALPLLDAADVAKIDIEGGEWPLLADPRLRTAGVQAVVLELHDDGAGGTAYRERACELLRDAGFVCGPLFDERPDTACVWAWRPTRTT